MCPLHDEIKRAICDMLLKDDVYFSSLFLATGSRIESDHHVKPTYSLIISIADYIWLHDSVPMYPC